MNAPLVAPIRPGIWGGQFADEPPPPAWLWDGYLAPGNVTLLTSQWKSGKTTLIAALLARLKADGTFAGRTVRPAKAAVFSEEARALWRPRHERLGLDHVYFLCQPCRGKPTPDEWHALLDHAAALRAGHGIELLVIDTLTTFLPGRNEATAGVMMEALLPLRQLTDLGLAVLLAHHPAKGAPAVGQAARGSGALAAFTDVNIEMAVRNRADPADRRRRLLAQSRHDDTPRLLTLELNAAATDYALAADAADDEFAQNWDVLRGVLEEARGKWTRQQLRDAWPADFPTPCEMTLSRWLTRAVAAGFVAQDGAGRRSDPFRYWLPSRLKQLEIDPLYIIEKNMEEDRRRLDELLGPR